MSPRTPKRHAAIAYLRRSQATDDQGSLTYQREQVCALIAAKGWDLVDVVVEDDTSAYRGGGKRQKLLEGALARIERGEADRLVSWRWDRLARRVAGVWRIIMRLEDAGAALVTVENPIDTSTPTGKGVASLLGMAAELESETKAANLRQVRAGERASGRGTIGPRHFGLSAGRVDLVPAEADAIREGAAWVLAGVSLREVARRWNAAGLTTSAGKPWDGRGVARMLTSPVVAGLIAAGEPRPDGRLGSDVTMPGSFPAILERDQWTLLRALLTAPDRRTTTTNQRRNLLSGLVTCDRCGHVLVHKHHPTGARLACERRKGHLDACGGQSVSAALVEDFVVAELLDALDPSTVSDAAPSTSAIADVARLEAEVQELDAMYATGAITMDRWKTLNDGVRARLEDAQRQASSARLPVLDFTDLQGSWKRLTVLERRALVASYMPVLRLVPAAPGCRGADRVKITWAD